MEKKGIENIPYRKNSLLIKNEEKIKKNLIFSSFFT